MSMHPSYKRGDIVLFRPKSCIRHNVSLNILLVGVVVEAKPYFSTKKEIVSCKYVLTVHVAGKCCPKYFLCDDVMQLLLRPRDQSLSQPLEDFRREQLLTDIGNKRCEAGCSIDSAELECSQVKALDDILLGSRHLCVEKILDVPRQLKIWQSEVLRPSAYKQRIERMLSFLESKNQQSLQYMKITGIHAWYQQARALKEQSLYSAAVVIQKHIRGYVLRKAMSRKRDRFEAYYTTPGEHTNKHCYIIKDGTFLSTQAKANEWFSLLNLSISIIAHHSECNARNRMSVAIEKWKEAINRQKNELEDMYNEELFSFV